MSKKYCLFKYSLLLAVIITTAACHKDLYNGPIGSTYGSEFWTTQTNVEKAALAMYGQLRVCVRSSNSFLITGDLAAGTFLPDANQWNLETIKSDASPSFNFSYVPYYEGDLQNWSRYYKLIAQCNLILQNVPAMPAADFSSEAVRNSYMGEALFMRAYAYFLITRVWGDPVYVTRSYNDVDYGNIPAVARTPESIVLDSCIDDLKQAHVYLNYTGGDPSLSIRASKGSTSALLAHIYAWKHDYANAHLYCKEVIDNGGYALEPMATYKNIWKGKSSSESIFELPMTYDANDPNFSGQGDWAEAQFGFFGTFLKGTVIDNQKSTCWIAPEGGLIDQTLFDTANDARFKTVFTIMPASGGDEDGYMLTKYTNFIYQQPDSKTLPYINNDFVLFRLADIYLLDAEALASTGDLAGAAQDLSMTENRAGITSYQNPDNAYDMMDEVVLERGRELVGEGQWFYDLIRTEAAQQWLEYIGYTPDRVAPDAKGYYWPLDMGTLFPYDNLLTQNPYWATHK